MSEKTKGNNWIIIIIIMLMFGLPIMMWIYQTITNTTPPYERCEPRWTSEGYVSDCTIEEARGEN